MDIYFKKEITYSFAGEKFKFEVGNTLFSTFGIDHGTDVLIRAIDSENPKTILDLGCGYGPLGIILAKKFSQAQVTMVDRDLLAVRYTGNNIKKNNITNVTVFGSIGMEQVSDQKFDLIVSNIPAKIGDEAIAEEFILNPFKHLNIGGEYWFVVVNALNHLVPSVGRKNKLNIKEIRKRNGHTVYLIKKL
ncbi:MAG: methyltransferase [Candidatus Daviesbacteria bacterium]|nr:methyltransferase [Candidatus Daviesbacteria bacterium]